MCIPEPYIHRLKNRLLFVSVFWYFHYINISMPFPYLLFLSRILPPRYLFLEFFFCKSCYSIVSHHTYIIYTYNQNNRQNNYQTQKSTCKFKISSHFILLLIVIYFCYICIFKIFHLFACLP